MEPTAAVCKPEEGEVVSTTTFVVGESLVVGEINTGDGLGDGHNFVALVAVSNG